MQSMNIMEVLQLSVAAIATAISPIKEDVSLQVGDVKRTAIVEAPAEAKKQSSPVILAFHGHGGNMRQAARSFNIAKHWPEAIVVYPQGLATATARDPKGERAGWQNRVSLNGDRDLKFVDALVAKLRATYRVDGRRIFAMGHSNGGGFTYLLLRERPKLFAGFGPSGANGWVGTGMAKPVFHIAGRNDAIVSFASQQRTLDALFGKNDLNGTKDAWNKQCTYYASKSATPVATYISDAGHQFQGEAVPFMVRFFKSL